MTWAAIAVLAAGTYALKASGPLLLGDRRLPPAIARLADLLPAALLTALIAIGVATSDRRIDPDARLAGVVAAVVAVRLRASFLVVVGGACAATAMARSIPGW